eukprot:scaffold2236_cov152-Skeletonema_menzelii.AAC.26
MSLSFVKSAVLSSTDGISHNEETTIDNPETASVRANTSSSGTHKPLFEQLRANKELQDAKDDEFQKSIRGMQALDEEDVAHLDAMEEQKREVEERRKSGIEREVALFHAAREDRGLVQTVMQDHGEGGGDNSHSSNDGADETKTTSIVAGAVPAAKKQIVPKFTIKKKRRRVETTNDDTAQKKTSVASAESNKSKDEDAGEKQQVEEEVDKPNSNNVADLLGLGCYGSDSDSD